MIILIILAILLICFGVLLLRYLQKQKQKFGVLSGNRIYQDTEKRPGYPLFAKNIPLKGKPDYLLKENGIIIPVEVKRGKTPTSPYLNHSMQLMAYCYLVEEHFGIRPPGGYIQYASAEYKLAYTDEARASVIQIVAEIVECRKHNTEFPCKHPEHNL